jgi:hypothetical protein
MGVREDNFVATAAAGPGAAEPINAQCNFWRALTATLSLLSCKNKRRCMPEKEQQGSSYLNC